MYNYEGIHWYGVPGRDQAQLTVAGLGTGLARRLFIQEFS
jgi:hypothetical protein